MAWGPGTLCPLGWLTWGVEERRQDEEQQEGRGWGQQARAGPHPGHGGQVHHARGLSRPKEACWRAGSWGRITPTAGLRRPRRGVPRAPAAAGHTRQDTPVTQYWAGGDTRDNTGGGTQGHAGAATLLTEGGRRPATLRQHIRTRAVRLAGAHSQHSSTTPSGPHRSATLVQFNTTPPPATVYDD